MQFALEFCLSPASVRLFQLRSQMIWSLVIFAEDATVNQSAFVIRLPARLECFMRGFTGYSTSSVSGRIVFLAIIISCNSWVCLRCVPSLPLLHNYCGCASTQSDPVPVLTRYEQPVSVTCPCPSISFWILFCQRLCWIVLHRTDLFVLLSKYLSSMSSKLRWCRSRTKPFSAAIFE